MTASITLEGLARLASQHVVGATAAWAEKARWLAGLLQRRFACRRSSELPEKLIQRHFQLELDTIYAHAPSSEEHRKARERKRRAECDDPRVAVGPSVSLECGARAPAETKGKAMRHGVKSLRESWRRAGCAPGRTQDERGPPKAMAVA